MPDCTRIWARVRAAVSAAKSASRIWLSASVRLTNVSFKAFLFVSSDVRWNAPNRPRRVVTSLIASSTMLGRGRRVGRTGRPSRPSPAGTACR